MMSEKKSKSCRGKSVASEIAGILPLMRAFAWRLSRNPADAEDLVQDTVLKAIQAEGSFDGQNLRAWVFTIMRNHAVNFHRKRARWADAEDLMSASSCGVWSGIRPLAPDAGLEGEPVREAVSSLSPDKREAVLAFGLDGLSYKEIAEEIGHPIGTVMSRLHRARRSFAEAMPSRL